MESLYLCFELKKEEGLLIALACNNNNKPNLHVAISDDLLTSKNLHAGNIIRELAKEINGGGGGQPFYASAGGSDMNGVDAALSKVKEFIS